MTQTPARRCDLKPGHAQEPVVGIQGSMLNTEVMQEATGRKMDLQLWIEQFQSLSNFLMYLMPA